MGKADNQVESEEKKEDTNENENSKNEKEQIRLTVKEVAEVIDETSTTVRNWLRELKRYIPTQKAENGYNLFDEESLSVLRQIKKLHREQGYSINQVKTYFDTGGEVFKPVNKEAEMKKEIEELKERMNRQEEFNKALIEKLEQQQTYIDQRLNERDKLLLENIRQTFQETAATKEKKRGFFRRLFKK